MCSYKYHRAILPLAALLLGLAAGELRGQEVPHAAMNCVPVASCASPPVEVALSKAASYLGVPWRWGGRGTAMQPGMGCMALVFFAWGEASGTAITRYATDPSKLVASGLLGAPVPGLDGVLRADLDMDTLQRGDVLYFLMEGYEIQDEPLLVRGDLRYWPWHMGLYADEGSHQVLHADPASVVRRQPLEEVAFDALFVTRPAAVVPAGG